MAIPKRLRDALTRLRAAGGRAIGPLRARVEAKLGPVVARVSRARERGADLWGRLPERDQRIVVSLGGALLAAVVLGGAFLGSSHQRKLENAIGSRTKQLEEVRTMRTEYRAMKDRLESIDQRLKASSGPPRSFLEEKARESRVDGGITSMEEKAAPPNEMFKTIAIDVRLKKVTLANVARYLHRIETTGVGMSVRTLDLSPNFQDGRYLDAKIQVLALRPKEE